MSKIICLTAGHSNTDPGAVNGSDREADLAQDMRNIVASILRNDYGLTVKTDGTGKGNMPLRDAVKLIRGSDVAIEFHTNAAANKTATGIEALSTPKINAGVRCWAKPLPRKPAGNCAAKTALSRITQGNIRAWLMRRQAALCLSLFHQQRH